jgi:hypothetical protein
MVVAVMMDFINGSRCQRRWRWDGGTMLQCHWQQWRLWPMVVAAMVVVVVNCAAVVDATATIPSSALMAAAKMPLPPPPSTVASINDECYCRH